MKGQSLMILLAIYAMFMVSRIDAQRTSTVTRTTTTVTTVSVTILKSVCSCRRFTFEIDLIFVLMAFDSNCSAGCLR